MSYLINVYSVDFPDRVLQLIQQIYVSDEREADERIAQEQRGFQGLKFVKIGYTHD